MARNHRGFVDASLAAAKLGADMLYLNTAFAGPAARRGARAGGPGGRRPRRGVHRAAGEGRRRRPRVVAWVDGDPVDVPTVEELIEKGSADARAAAAGEAEPDHHPDLRHHRHARRAPRAARPASTPPSSLLSRMPLRRGWTTHIAAPLFHTWGWAHLALAMLLESTVVLRRKFDPEGCLEAVAEHDCDSLVVIPVMLQRIMKLPDGDARLLRPLAASRWSPPPAPRCPATSASTGWTSSATTSTTSTARPRSPTPPSPTPQDLREAPGTAGKPPHATIVQDLRRGRPAGRRRARPAGSSSATASCSRATPAAATRT